MMATPTNGERQALVARQPSVLSGAAWCMSEREIVASLSPLPSDWRPLSFTVAEDDPGMIVRGAKVETAADRARRREGSATWGGRHA